MKVVLSSSWPHQRGDPTSVALACFSSTCQQIPSATDSRSCLGGPVMTARMILTEGREIKFTGTEDKLFGEEKPKHNITFMHE